MIVENKTRRSHSNRCLSRHTNSDDKIEHEILRLENCNCLHQQCKNNLRELIIETAEKEKIEFQRYVASRITGTDAFACFMPLAELFRL